MFALRRTAAALLALAAGTIAACAAEAVPPPFTYTDINTEVMGHPGVVYLDLLRQFVPDLTPNETIAKGTAPTAPVPHIMGKPFVTHLPETVTFASFQTRTIKEHGARRLLILTPVGVMDGPDRPVLLMAFSDDAMPKLLDVLDVSMDELVSIGQPFRIGAGDEAIVATSAHDKDGESYGADALLFLRHGKFDSIGSGFFRFGKTGCGFERSQALAVNTRPAGAAYDDVTVTIKDVGRHIDNNCTLSAGEAPYDEAYSALYHWDAATSTFMGDSAEIDRLKDINDTRR